MHEPFNLGDLGAPATSDGDVALIDCRDWENPRILSHGEFDRQVKACARAIAARGLARGDRVAILSLNRAEVLIAYFAIMRVGLVAVPANVKCPRETVAFIVQDAQIKFAFCDAAGRALLPAEIPLIDFDATGVDGFASFLDFGPFETIRPKPRGSRKRCRLPFLADICCKSRKSNDVKNLAKVDFWPTWPLQYSVTPIRSSLVVLVRNDVVPHIASSETHQWS
jgi:hypothetical protein